MAPADQIVGASRAIGVESDSYVASQQTIARVEAMLNSRLLMTAFQPIVDLVTGTVLGAEALTRFVAESGDTPDVWFCEAASVGLGTELELLAVRTALVAAAELPEHLYVSLNASPAACLQPSLADIILESSIRPDRVVLEITEHTRVVDYQPLVVALGGLRRRGVRIAIDDAGAGFASFMHVLRLSPEIIKLDRAIISGIDEDPARRALATALVGFARHIGADVIAEGIETAAELRAVTDVGLTTGQGYLLGHPSVSRQHWVNWTSGTSVTERSCSAAIGLYRQHTVGPIGPGRRSTRDAALAHPMMTGPIDGGRPGVIGALKGGHGAAGRAAARNAAVRPASAWTAAVQRRGA